LTFPAGQEAYRTGRHPVWGRGVKLAEEEAEDAGEAVGSVLWDSGGKAELDELLGSLATTSFETSAVEAILASDERSVDDWRAGEAVAQAHLEANLDCTFPWGTRRDLKNPSASPAGAELVGFDKRHDPPRLVVGEVKTSAQNACPPSVVYGEDGLQKQLVSTRDQQQIIENLLRWLGMRAIDASWQDDYRAAAERFLAHPKDFSIFGVLIRTVDPDEADLRSTAESLVDGSDPPISVALEALYVSADWLSAVSRAPGEGR
jgi:hypothetical protein